MQSFVWKGKTINNKTYYRGIFGLSKEQEWRSEKENKLLKIQTELDRIPSPFIFKVFKTNSTCKVYFWIKYAHNLDAIFNFSVHDANSSNKLKEGLQMRTPNDFNFEEYMEYIFSNKGIKGFNYQIEKLK